VIDAEIRVFQQYRREAVIRGWRRRSRGAVTCADLKLHALGVRTKTRRLRDISADDLFQNFYRGDIKKPYSQIILLSVYNKKPGDAMNIKPTKLWTILSTAFLLSSASLASARKAE
jgi:hypothetical protein